MILTALLLSNGVSAKAQHLGLNLRGDAGLMSGSQPHPGYYFTVPVFYRAGYDSIRDRSGNEITDQINLDMMLLAPAVVGITKAQVLGANYGFQVVPGFMNYRLNLAARDAQGELGFGFTDLYVQPVNLGWHLKGADFLVAYGLYAPTGVGERSLDMWAHEFVAGSTVYLTQSKNIHIATTAYYDIHHKKSDEDVRVGDYLTLEGGMGVSFLKGAASAGLAYLVQMKTTDDSGDDLGPLAESGRNNAYGVGPEVTFPIFAKGKTVGLINARYTFEFGNSTNFQGDNLIVSFTLARLQ